MERSHTADIAPGSQWTGRDGTRVRVLGTTATHVRFLGPAGERLLHHWHFREHYSAPYNAQKFRSWFAMTTANLQDFHLFWSPSRQKAYGRSSIIPRAKLFTATRGRPALPADAIYVNTYVDGANPHHAESDLNDALACADHRAAA